MTVRERGSGAGRRTDGWIDTAVGTTVTSILFTSGLKKLSWMGKEALSNILLNMSDTDAVIAEILTQIIPMVSILTVMEIKE